MADIPVAREIKGTARRPSGSDEDLLLHRCRCGRESRDQVTLMESWGVNVVPFTVTLTCSVAILGIGM